MKQKDVDRGATSVDMVTAELTADNCTGSQNVPLCTEGCQLHLLQLDSGSGTEPLVYRLSEYDLDRDDVEFQAFTYVPAPFRAVQQNQQSSGFRGRTPGYPHNVLVHLRSIDRQQLLWNFELCVDKSDENNIRRHIENLKTVYTKAKKVTVWVGPDAEDEDDVFTSYIGTANEQTMTRATQFAQDFADAGPDTSIHLLARQDDDGVNDWVHLMRLLYRTFCQGTALLKTNYVHQLQNTSVQWSSSCQIEFPVLYRAWQRLLLAKPMPYFLRKLEFTERNRLHVRIQDREYLLASLRLGFESSMICAQMRWLFKQGSNDEKRFAGHLSYCDDIYDIECRLFKGAGYNYTQKLISLEDGEQVPVDEDNSSSGDMKPPPIRDFEGYTLHPPPAKHQAPYIDFNIDYKRKIRLLEILPDPNKTAPLQCATRDFPAAEAPEYAVVVNDGCLRRSLPEPVAFHGVDYRLATRHVCAILVNGQAWIVPKLQELFLLLVRDEKDRIYLWIWNICLPPGYDKDVETRKQAEDFTRTKRIMTIVAKERTIDMLKTLMRAGSETPRDELEAILGLPKATSWDEWMLELNE